MCWCGRCEQVYFFRFRERFVLWSRTQDSVPLNGTLILGYLQVWCTVPGVREYRHKIMSALLRVADSFVNIRGSFKIGPLDIGTHCSLVKRKNGKWLMLDSLKLEPDVKAQVDQLTNDGKDIESIVNLHPFHTVRVYCVLCHFRGLPCSFCPSSCTCTPTVHQCCNSAREMIRA